MSNNYIKTFIACLLAVICSTAYATDSYYFIQKPYLLGPDSPGPNCQDGLVTLKLKDGTVKTVEFDGFIRHYNSLTNRTNELSVYGTYLNAEGKPVTKRLNYYDNSSNNYYRTSNTTWIGDDAFEALRPHCRDF